MKATTQNGRTDLLNRPSDTLDMFDVTNSTCPTGGVMNPIVSVMQKITPQWTGSTPHASAIGAITGVNINIELVISRTHPAATRTMRNVNYPTLR